MIDEKKESFVCQGCKHDLPIDFSLRTDGYCYLCDPNITLEECLSDKPIEGLSQQTLHELKVWPEHFIALDNRIKRFEVRKNDRDFKVGDVLWLREYVPESNSYTGQYLYSEITYILKGGLFGIDDSYVVMSLTDAE